MPELSEVEFQEKTANLIQLCLKVRSDYIIPASFMAAELNLQDARLDLHKAERAIKRVYDVLSSMLPPMECPHAESLDSAAT